MTKEELGKYLVSESYSYERDDEYNRDVYTKDLVVDDKTTKLEVHVDRYTAKAIW